jgi:hypothetical protein
VSYTKLITEDNPTIIWPLDDLFGSTSGSSNSINFTSASSYRALINITNTFYGKQPLVYGAKNSACIETTAVGISVPALGMLSEYSKNRSYSIEFWMRWSKVPPTEEKIMIRKGTTTNGVFIKGSNIIFRCGDEDKYVETSQVVKNVDNPTHIVIRYSESSIELIVNGQFSSTEIDSPIYENVDVNHNTNDFIDFYGLTGALVYYDAIAIYPRKLSTYSALRHYMYGVGHSVEEETFSSRGGEFYNISLAQTKPSYFKTLVTYDDFNFISTVNYENIYHNEN